MLSGVHVSHYITATEVNQRLSLSGARISRPTRDFLVTFSASVMVGHCGLVLEGCVITLLLDGFDELSTAVNSRGLALEDCVVIFS